MLGRQARCRIVALQPGPLQLKTERYIQLSVFVLYKDKDKQEAKDMFLSLFEI